MPRIKPKIGWKRELPEVSTDKIGAAICAWETQRSTPLVEGQRRKLVLGVESAYSSFVGAKSAPGRKHVGVAARDIRKKTEVLLKALLSLDEKTADWLLSEYPYRKSKVASGTDELIARTNLDMLNTAASRVERYCKDHSEKRENDFLNHLIEFATLDEPKPVDVFLYGLAAAYHDAIGQNPTATGDGRKIKDSDFVSLARELSKLLGLKKDNSGLRVMCRSAIKDYMDEWS